MGIMRCFLWMRGASTTFHKTMKSSPSSKSSHLLITTRILAISLTWRSRSICRFPRSDLPVTFASQTFTCLWQQALWEKGNKIYRGMENELRAKFLSNCVTVKTFIFSVLWKWNVSLKVAVPPALSFTDVLKHSPHLGLSFEPMRNLETSTQYT